MKIFKDLWRVAHVCDIGMIDLIRLKREKRRVPGYINFGGKRLQYVDACTLLESLEDIFVKQCYIFTPSSTVPRIIDCGANIGISTIFFKNLYPNARVTALEADPAIFTVLRNNMIEFGYTSVEAMDCAVWTTEGSIAFRREGGLSGRIACIDDRLDLETVRTVRLKDLLHEKIDFLKIDIEGAEVAVLNDCRDALNNVQNIFVEYHSHCSVLQELQTLLKLLGETGFRYHIKEAYTVKHPFIEIPTLDGMDMQLNIYAWRN